MIDEEATHREFEESSESSSSQPQSFLQQPSKLLFQPINQAKIIDRAPELVFGENAIKKVKQLIQEEENPNYKLRIYVQGGGCAGLEYGFVFDEQIEDDDYVIERGGVTLLIDAASFAYLKKAEIDYKEDISGAQFVIKNPMAVTSCGCGSSFSVDQEDDFA